MSDEFGIMAEFGLGAIYTGYGVSKTFFVYKICYQIVTVVVWCYNEPDTAVLAGVALKGSLVSLGGDQISSCSFEI